MKTLNALFTAVLFLGLAVSGFSQTQQDVSVSANVVAGIEVLDPQPLSFGTIAIGNTVERPALTHTAAELGRVTVISGIEQNVQITISAPANLTDEAKTLGVTFNAAYGADEGGDARVSIADISSVGEWTGFQGTRYIFIGGSINSTGAEAGNYTGEVTISAAIN